MNASKRYAPLRQVYYSLILAQWFKQKYGSSGSSRATGVLPVRQAGSALVNRYIDLIDSGNLVNLISNQPYDKQSYFQQYQKSFKDGEYSLQEPVYTPMGQSIRRYVSGGTLLNCSSAIEAGKIESKQLLLPFHNPQYLIPANTGLSGTTSSSSLPVVINTPTNLQQLPFEEMRYKNPEEFLEEIKEFVRNKQNASIVRELIGDKLNHEPGKIRELLNMAEQRLTIEIQKLTSQGELVVTPFHPEQLNEGDIVMMPKGYIGVYMGSKRANSRPYLLSESTGKETWGDKWPQMKALTEKQIAEWKPLTMYLFDSLGSSYSGRTIREEDYGEYRIIRARSVIDIKNASSSGNVSSSLMPVMVKYFISKLHSLGANINGIDEIKSEAIVDDNINDLQWYIYAMSENRYLELFINKNNDAIAYGVITLMPQNTVLRFHSFTKNTGQGDYWADVYRQRMDKLSRIFPSMSVIAIPTDQIISEDQLAKRIGEYIKKYDGQNLPQIMLIIADVIKAIRLGMELTEEQIKMATYSGFEGFYSFGPAANFYVNKLGFSLVPAGVAIHKHTISKEEQNLLDKLKVGGFLEELEIIRLFSGRGLVKRVSSSLSNTSVSSAVENSILAKETTIKDLIGRISVKNMPCQYRAIELAQELSKLKLFPNTDYQVYYFMEKDDMGEEIYRHYFVKATNMNYVFDPALDANKYRDILPKSGIYLMSEEIIEQVYGHSLVISPKDLDIFIKQMKVFQADKGGIAFNALPIQTRAMPVVSSAITSNFKPLSSAELEAEWAQIQAMVNAALRPAPERLERYAVSVRSGLDYPRARDKLVGLLADILRNDETSQRQPRLEPALKNILLALERE